MATKCKEQNKQILDMNSLCRRLPDSILDSSISLLQRVYTVLTNNCHKATRYTNITRQSVQKCITISVHFLSEQKLSLSAALVSDVIMMCRDTSRRSQTNGKFFCLTSSENCFTTSRHIDLVSLKLSDTRSFSDSTLPLTTEQRSQHFGVGCSDAWLQ